jgi:pterin-4a-carbinolamine dehydratase
LCSSCRTKDWALHQSCYSCNTYCLEKHRNLTSYARGHMFAKRVDIFSTEILHTPETLFLLSRLTFLWWRTADFYKFFSKKFFCRTSANILVLVLRFLWEKRALLLLLTYIILPNLHNLTYVICCCFLSNLFRGQGRLNKIRGRLLVQGCQMK